MKYITVDQFKGSDWVDVYVMDDRVNDMLEIKQGLSLAKGFEVVNKFKNEYGINKVDFKLYDKMERLIKSEEITL